MLNAFKDVFLQIMLSGIFTFQIPLLFSKPHSDREDHQSLVIMTSAVSILLCFGLSTSLFEVIPIDMGILPLFAGILYGTRASGLLLSLLYIGCHVFINEFSLSGIFLQTGLPLYPLMFFLSHRFKHSSVMEKIGCLWLGLIPALIIILASSLFEGKVIDSVSHTEMIVITLLYVLLYIFNGVLLIYFIEKTHRRLFPELFQDNSSENNVLKQLLEVIPLGMSVIDRRGTIIMMNEHLASYYKQSYPHFASGHLIGRTFYEAFKGTGIPEVLNQLITQALRGTQSGFEVIREGTMTFLAGTFPLVNPRTQHIDGVVTIVQDITEKENLKSELINFDRLSMVGQMAASITHEIRNPMAVIRGFLQLMKEKSPDTLDHYYRIVMDELDRANGIISDFLSLAQNRIVEKERCHIHDIIHELGPLLWADANLRGQSIDLRLDSYVPRMDLNSNEIKQLILNLCRNAMEAMDDKGVLTIETRRVDDVVELCVSDTGPGIPKEKLDRLFEPFFTTKSKGTGLGLALCMSIVQRHQGEISVQSEEGVGTTFTISFPGLRRDKDPLPKP
ncbi:two-component system sensor histidine kinase NtrB [Paenibacillus dakarensis]|uniref:two-component system sensor histidine kinase NtrB n=1 Tax=Paenibacillus dakarensis TaxID=1527293 RepID=UPI0006D59731|nr:ATP-binding protein [Paenibacillus dakarensis]